MKLVEFFSRQPRWILGMIGLGLVFGIGVIDYATGPNIALLFFYLAPICLNAWFGGRWLGLAMTCASGCAIYGAQLLDTTHASTGGLLLWNMSVRTGVLAVVGFLTSEVAERKRVEAALRRQTDILQSIITSHKLMEKQIAEVSDREQRRIGQDLHDGLCQHLVSTAFATELLREKLAARGMAESARVETISDMVNQAINQARQLARGLYPVRLEIDGLASALDEMAGNAQALHKIPCHFVCDEPVLIYDPVAGSNLFRIAQEALINAIKHGRCRQISIGLGAVQDEVTLTVKDDGIGFSETPPGNGSMGLHIMKYRAQMIGAALDIRRGAGGGTIVICSFHNENRVKESHGHPNE